MKSNPLQVSDTKRFALAGPLNGAQLLRRVAALDFPIPALTSWDRQVEPPPNVWATSPCYRRDLPASPYEARQGSLVWRRPRQAALPRSLNYRLIHLVLLLSALLLMTYLLWHSSIHP
ncbi:hypothetical protein EHF33_06230 [Deinococcus psychrotolerans]|uniref:Uncharacterized protein n=1 Tax=Deinococcus psychrotolerans TaxID=2489213 RepID=A0A3G8YAI1_9DEIO|nr:hypothetical protein [Deinococcus psychrotolerans]AZI42398.1 hypothetical protein EHF33_06230 [Deinococcus psychrotolerans]